MKSIMTALAVTICSLGIAAPVEAQAGGILSQAIDATSRHEAQFTHTFRLHGSEQEIVESGVVTFGDLPQMRWNYESPEAKVFVFDGRTSWLYVPADRQVSIHELTDSERSSLPFLLLENEQAAKRDFVITSAKRRGEIVLSLSPRGQAQIRDLELSLDPGTKRIRSISYRDLEGNFTRFAFERFRKVSHDAGQFRFEAPAGVEPVEY